MEKLNIEKFSPKVAELKELVAVSKDITAKDLKDKNQLEVVKRCRIDLGKARIEIEKTGKSLRDEANAFNKAVLTKQKELIGIVQPEENRLKAIENEAKDLEIREQRLEQLPERKERLDAIGDPCREPDENILEMGDLEFEGYYNKRVADKNNSDKEALETQRIREEEESEEKAEELRIEAELKEKKAQDIRDAEQAKIKAQQDKLDKDKVDLEADKLKIKHAQELKDAEEKAKKEAEAQAKKDVEDKEKERIAEEKRIADEKEAEAKILAKRKEYREFRAEHGYTPETKKDFMETEENGVIILFKKVGEFKK